MEGSALNTPSPVVQVPAPKKVGTVAAILSLAKPTTRGPRTRGLRNNNPGNIRHGPNNWLGVSEVQPDASFVSFISMEYGIRAIAVILHNYQSKHGLNTIQEIINRWAPPNENNTAAYIDAVCHDFPESFPTMHVELTRNNSDMCYMVRGIVDHENYKGCSTDLYLEIKRGVGLAFHV